MTFGLPSGLAADTKEITWVLAHTPASVFERAAKAFSSEVYQKTDKKITVRVISANDLLSRKAGAHEALNAVRSGTAQMSQVYTSILAVDSPDLLALDLPFLFRSHAHAEKVLEGKIGQKLLASLDKKQLKGLAFTYSGGYEVIPTTTKEIHKLEDLKGMRIRTTSSPISRQTLLSWGAEPVSMDVDESTDSLKKNLIDGKETTYARFTDAKEHEVVKIVNETEHRLFLTGVVINQDFFSSLPKEHQTVIANAALRAARMEREQSIEDGIASRKSASQHGVKIIALSKSEHARLELASLPVYEKFPEHRALVKQIKAVK